jgi:spore maturation protein CgeB
MHSLHAARSDKHQPRQYGSHRLLTADRVFEAAGAGACLIVDAWEGIEMFLEPQREVLIACNGEEVSEHLTQLDAARATIIGGAALRRVRAQHTYAQRALEVEAALCGRNPQEAAA